MVLLGRSSSAIGQDNSGPRDLCRLSYSRWGFRIIGVALIREWLCLKTGSGE